MSCLNSVNEYKPATQTWTRSYLFTDHLGSVVAVTDSAWTLISQQRYLPFGGVRTNIGSILQTDYGYTRQRNLDEGIGLMDYKARFYSPVLNRFIQPDSIVPNPMSPQMFNRFGYVGNNPINFNDPTGHLLCDADGYCDKNSPINQKNNGNGGGCMGTCPKPKPSGSGSPDDRSEDKPLYGICIAGGFVNPEGAESGTGDLCGFLNDKEKIEGFKVIGNTYSEWHTFYIDNSALLADYNLMIIGYSKGGQGAMELAYYLDNKNIAIAHLFLIDPALPTGQPYTIDYKTLLLL